MTNVPLRLMTASFATIASANLAMAAINVTTAQISGGQLVVKGIATGGTAIPPSACLSTDMNCGSVNLLFFIRISPFRMPRKFYFQTPSKNGGITMWAVRRMIDLAELPRRRIVVRFHFRDDPPPKYLHYWFVVEPGADLPELCSLDPRRDVDLCVETGVASLGAIIEGRSSIEREKEGGGIYLSGDPGHARSMDRWLRTSVYAKFEGIVPLS